MVEVNILTFNVRGLRNKTKRLKIFNYLKKFSADIILIQEAHVLSNDQGEWKTDWGLGEVYINPLKDNSGGQIILFKKKHIKCSRTKLLFKVDVKNLFYVYSIKTLTCETFTVQMIPGIKYNTLECFKKNYIMTKRKDIQ